MFPQQQEVPQDGATSTQLQVMQTRLLTESLLPASMQGMACRS
jgi:hypothetical protein